MSKNNTLPSQGIHVDPTRIRGIVEELDESQQQEAATVGA